MPGECRRRFVDPARAAASLDTAAHRALARRVAEGGATLLKNDLFGGGRALPLSGLGSTIRTVAVRPARAEPARSRPRALRLSKKANAGVARRR